MDRTYVKVCGLTRVDEALECVRAGAEWIGLNFHPASPRYVSPALARKIVNELPRPAKAVGVFVNRLAREVAELAGELGLEIIQLHGDEPPEDIRFLEAFRVVRAFRVGSAEDLGRMTTYLRSAAECGRAPDAILVDAHVPGQAGGTGVTIPEEILQGLPTHERLILAGGLSPRNVAERIAQVRPWMVDVASGVESSPGRKDLALVRSFIEAARSVHSSRGSGNPVP